MFNLGENVVWEVKLAEGMVETPQSLVDDLTQGQEPASHDRPTLVQRHLKQRTHDPGCILEKKFGRDYKRCEESFNTAIAIVAFSVIF